MKLHQKIAQIDDQLDVLNREIRTIEREIRRLPPGSEKEALGVQFQLAKTGLFASDPESKPRHQNPSRKNLIAQAEYLRSVARVWSAHGRFDKAAKCREDAKQAEEEANLI